MEVGGVVEGREAGNGESMVVGLGEVNGGGVDCAGKRMQGEAEGGGGAEGDYWGGRGRRRRLEKGKPRRRDPW